MQTYAMEVINDYNFYTPKFEFDSVAILKTMKLRLAFSCVIVNK